MTDRALTAVPLPALPVAEVDRAREFARLEKAEATRRAYRADWDSFTRWCGNRAVKNLPASPETVAAYLASEADAGRRPATLARRVAAIRYAHSLKGFEPPTASETVRATVRGIRRARGVAPRQKSPATAEVVGAMVSHIDAGTLRGLRDRAVLLFGFAGAFRRSELAALNVDDLERAEGGLRVIVRRSKGDQEGAGQLVAVPHGHILKPVAALDAWLSAAGIAEGALFRSVGKGGRLGGRLSDKSIAAIVKRYAGLAKLDPAAFAGHSLRAGFVTSAIDRGAGVMAVMDQTRHKDARTLRGYVRKAEAFRNHPGEAFL